jgi:pimeloyl-ACP methyl ester carboxylesterase
MSSDVDDVLIDGDWKHRFVSANGARFHVAEAGEGTLVVLLHGFPQFWWTWRHQLPALAEAGYRAVAMDLRGVGASDKPPRGYETTYLAADVAGVIRALGESTAVVVGHDIGAWVAWAMPTLQPRVTAAVAALSMGHPLAMRHQLLGRRGVRVAPRLLAAQLPVLPERSLRSHDGAVATMTAGRAPGHPQPDDEAECYRRAAAVPFVSHTSLEPLRWATRSLGPDSLGPLGRRDRRRFTRTLAQPIRARPLARPGCGRNVSALGGRAADPAGRSRRRALLARRGPGSGHRRATGVAVVSLLTPDR